MFQAEVRQVPVTHRQSLGRAHSKKDKDLFFQLLLTSPHYMELSTSNKSVTLCLWCTLPTPQSYEVHIVTCFLSSFGHR